MMRTIDDVLQAYEAIPNARQWMSTPEKLMIAEIIRLRGQVAALREAVTTAERVFGDYANHHRAKSGAAGAYGKYLANAALRVKMTEALTATTPEGGE